MHMSIILYMDVYICICIREEASLIKGLIHNHYGDQKNQVSWCTHVGENEVTEVLKFRHL